MHFSVLLIIHEVLLYLFRIHGVRRQNIFFGGFFWGGKREQSSGFEDLSSPTRPGIELMPSSVKARVLTTGPPGDSLVVIFLSR